MSDGMRKAAEEHLGHPGKQRGSAVHPAEEVEGILRNLRRGEDESWESNELYLSSMLTQMGVDEGNVDRYAQMIKNGEWGRVYRSLQNDNETDYEVNP